MTTRNPTHGDTPPIKRERAVEVLTEALEAEESGEKNYRIREALQLLALKGE